MFLHSGASLHGHEFSKRAAQAAASPDNRRNPLLRSTFSPSANRAPTLPAESSLAHDNEPVPDLKTSKTYPKSGAQNLDNALANTQELRSDLVASQVAAMSEDETSVISDTDGSRASSLTRGKRQSTFVLAHPPPRLRTKQKIIHMRPNLVLQIQQVTAGLRPKPTIDVYPSFAGAGSIMAPLLGRVPRIAGIKRELSGQDIMLVRSEDYALQASGSESDGDDDGITARDLLAVLSPSKTEDKAEIVMAEGMVWVASTRSVGNSYSYEFTSVGPNGTTITARWVLKQIISSSLPGTPTSPGPSNSAKPRFSDTKFTFSFIDQNYRRHPILAILTSTSLTIHETYTMVTQSQSSSPNSSSGGNQAQTEKSIRSVEQWQKSFISVSAVWVALRHGWAPDFRPDDFMPFRTSVTSQAEVCPHGRRRSLSTGNDPSAPHRYSEATGRRKYPTGIRQQALRSTNDLPRRATSTGAAFIQKRRAALRGSEDEPTDGERDLTTRLNRRALSGDWNVGLPKSIRENSLAESLMGSTPVSPKNNAKPHQPSALAPPPMPVKRRAVSAYLPLGSLATDLSDSDALELSDPSIGTAQKSLERGNINEAGGSKGKHRKWKNMANWFRKLSAR